MNCISHISNIDFYIVSVLLKFSFQVDALDSAQVKPRIKRAVSGQQSSKLSVKHLALELAEKQVSLTKIIFL